MPSMTIRDVRPDEDAEQVVALLAATDPTLVTSTAEWLHRIRSIPPRARQLLRAAEVDGRVVGVVDAGLSFFAPSDTAYLGLRVLAEFRRQGIGSALYAEAVEHARRLGSARATAMFVENDAGVAFARGRGWGEERAETLSTLDPRRVDDEPDPAITVVPARDLDPRELHRVDEEATRDMPAVETIESIPFDEWLDFVWDNPLFTRDGSFGAVVDGRVAAVSLVLANPETHRAANMFTGTSRAYRGRGLARAVKLASTRWARENGITTMVTTNDETNASMLAVNRRLGYEPTGRRVEYLVERERLLGERGEHL
jgi:GNAT superfamily N-acetyltransferase